MDQTFWDKSDVDPGKNVYLCGGCALAYRGQPKNVWVASIPYFSLTDQNDYGGANLNTSAWSTWAWPTGVAVFIAGISAVQEAPEGLLANWNSYGVNWDASGFPPNIVNAGNYLLQNQSVFYLNDDRPVWLIGHSWGGVVAHYLAVRARVNRPNRIIRVTSYGAFRGCNFVGGRWSSLNGFARFWQLNDPVRYVPPHADEIPTLAAVLPGQLVQGMDAMIQASGVQVTQDGQIIVGVNGDPGPQTTVVLNLLNWMHGTGVFGSEAHTIQSYMDCFSTALANEVPQAPPGPPAPPSPPLVTTARQLQTIRDRGESLITQAQTQGTLPPVTITVQPGPSTPVIGGPPLVLYKVKKVGTIWTVQYQGNVVAVGPGKRKAKQLRRQYNRALRDSLGL